MVPGKNIFFKRQLNDFYEISEEQRIHLGLAQTANQKKKKFDLDLEILIKTEQQ